MDLQNVFLTVWNMSLTASIIIVFVLQIRLFLRKCPKVFSYALWSVVLFRLLWVLRSVLRLDLWKVVPGASSAAGFLSLAPV